MLTLSTHHGAVVLSLITIFSQKEVFVANNIYKDLASIQLDGEKAIGKTAILWVELATFFDKNLIMCHEKGTATVLYFENDPNHKKLIKDMINHKFDQSYKIKSRSNKGW